MEEEGGFSSSSFFSLPQSACLPPKPLVLSTKYFNTATHKNKGNFEKKTLNLNKNGVRYKLAYPKMQIFSFFRVC